MKYFIISVVLFFSCSVATAFQEMSENEMKNTTAQFGSEAGDIGGLVSPVAFAADSFAPTLAPVSPVAYLYDIVSPHIDPASQLNETADSAAPVTRIMRTAGDISILGGLF
jgi:hypothetical protein